MCRRVGSVHCTIEVALGSRVVLLTKRLRVKPMSAVLPIPGAHASLLMSMGDPRLGNALLAFGLEDLVAG